MSLASRKMTVSPNYSNSNLAASQLVPAIQGAWVADFVNTSPIIGLEQHIARQLKPSSHSEATQIYGRYCSIIQSSGMGKSRLVDEFSKKFFLIPINLRVDDDRSYGSWFVLSFLPL
jgi:hypothetical protein